MVVYAAPVYSHVVPSELCDHNERESYASYVLQYYMCILTQHHWVVNCSAVIANAFALATKASRASYKYSLYLPIVGVQGVFRANFCAGERS